MKRIIQLFLVIMIIFTPNHALALSSKQGSDPTGKSQRYVIEQAPWLDPTICAPTNASIGTPGSAAQPGQTWLLGDSLSVGLKNVGLEEKLSVKGFPTKINANGGRSIKSEGGGSDAPGNGIEAVQNDSQYIKDSKNVVIALGTNDANNTNTDFVSRTFPVNQQELLDKIKDTGFNGKVFWVDVAAVGNGSNFNKAGAQVVNRTIYDNTSKGYSPISQYGFVWQDNNPNNIINKSLPDPARLLSTDGVHYTGDGYTKYADFITTSLSEGTGGSGSTTNTQNTNTGSTFSGFNPDPRATQIFNEQMKAQIEKLAPYYKKAAENTGFKNWEILPAIHYLEFGLREENPTTNTSYVSPFQMNADELRTKGGNPNDPVYAAGRKLSGEDITRQAEDVIKYWIDRFGVDGTKDFTVEDVLTIGIGYKSGSVYPGASSETHAYSWAGFDQGAKKLPMPWGPGWGRLPNGTIVSDQQEGKLVDRPGMITTYAMVKGGIQGGSSTSPGDCAEVDNGDDDSESTVGGSVVENATRIFNERGGQQGISGFPEYFHAGAWCADFVSYVYELSGKPFPGGKISSVAAMQAYFQNEGIWHPRGDGYTPQPGDVVVYNEGWGPYPQHVNMVMSVENNIITTIGGNEGNSVKRASFSKVDESYITGYGRPK